MREDKTEPECPNFESNDLIDKILIENAQRWMTWAKLRLTELSNSNRTLLDTNDTFAQQLQEKENKLRSQDKAIEGMREWIEINKSRVHVHEPGTKVKVAEGLTVTVEKVTIHEQGVLRYQIYWWVGGVRMSTVVLPSEIICSDDVLPVPTGWEASYK